MNQRYSTTYLILALLLTLFFQMTGPTWAKENKQPPSVTIRMTDEGRIYVGNTYTGLKGLVPHLKRKDFPPNTRITIEIPHNASDESIKRIGQTLATGHYFSMRFRKPRAATSRAAPLPGAAIE
jgi:biopolymer transport protein ExbD